MFDFANYRWYHWALLTAFVVSLYWLWVLYLLIAVFCFTSATADSTGAYRSSYGRPRGRPKPFRAQKIKPYRAPRVKKPRVYKGRTLKSGMRSTYDPVFKKWRNMAKDSTWKPPPD
jgi:hypothetical protein